MYAVAFATASPFDSTLINGIPYLGLQSLASLVSFTLGCSAPRLQRGPALSALAFPDAVRSLPCSSMLRAYSVDFPCLSAIRRRSRFWFWFRRHFGTQ